MLRQSSRKKDVKDICYSRLHLFLFVGFLVDGPPPKKYKHTAKYEQVVLEPRTHRFLKLQTLGMRAGDTSNWRTEF